MKEDKKPKETVHVWLARFESKKAFNEFFKETYTDSDDDPISKFAKSQNETFYDHDWLERMLDTKRLGQDSFIEKTVPGRYTEAVKTAAAQQSIKDANGIIMFHEHWGGTPKSKDENPKLWYLGEFNEITLKSYKSPDAYKADSIDKEWCTSFPQSDEELAALEKQSRKRKDNIPAVAKLAFMYKHGIYVKKDFTVSIKYSNKVEAYPEVMHELLLANAEAGKVEAWLDLFHLHGRETDISVDKERRLEFLYKAIELGSGEAEICLANMMLNSWTSPYDFEKDYEKMEGLFLSAYEKSACDAYDLFRLYSSKADATGKQADEEQAFKWLSMSVDLTGGAASLSYLVVMYQEGEGVTQDLAQMCKCIYLNLCQKEQADLREYNIERLELCDALTIQSGQDLAKEWIQKFGTEATNFKGERCNPFEKYLRDLSSID